MPKPPSKEYEVEKITNDRKKRIYNNSKKSFSYVKEYLIKWVGFTRKTWEPEENLSNCQDLLKEYFKSKGQKSAKKKKNKLGDKDNKKNFKFLGKKKKLKNINNSNNNTLTNNKLLGISQILVPNDSNKIKLVCKIETPNNEINYIEGERENLLMVPNNDIINCYEKVISKFFKGKVIDLS